MKRQQQCLFVSCSRLFFFNDTATTVIYTLSLHDALPISFDVDSGCVVGQSEVTVKAGPSLRFAGHNHARDPHRYTMVPMRSEEHTSELQSPDHLVCRLLLEKKKTYDHTVLNVTRTDSLSE